LLASLSSVTFWRPTFPQVGQVSRVSEVLQVYAMHSLVVWVRLFELQYFNRILSVRERRIFVQVKQANNQFSFC
jgi:hypothetical protein